MKLRLIRRAAVLLFLLSVSMYVGVSIYSFYILGKPRRVDSLPAPFLYHEVKLPAKDSGDHKVAGWYLPSIGSNKAVILVHGKDMSKGSEFQRKFPEFGRALRTKGLSVLLIDLRGHGNSSDSFVSFGLDERYDIIGAANWLKSRDYKPGSIGVLGVSMGAASAIGAAAEDSDIGAIVSDCSYAEIQPILEKQWSSLSGLPDFLLYSTLFTGRLLTGHDLMNAKPVVDIQRLSPRPVMIIHSLGDTLVPVHHAYALKEAYPSATLWVTGGSEHCSSYISAPNEYTRRVSDFFLDNLR